MLNPLRELFRANSGKDFDTITPLSADSSERRIFRIGVDSKSFIAVYNEHPEENRAYVGFTESFRKAGLNVPGVIAVSDDYFAYIVEDLGDVSLYKLLMENSGDREFCISICKKALEDLAAFQLKGSEFVDYGLCFYSDEFAGKVVNNDVDKFAKHFMAQLNGNKLPEDLIIEAKTTFNNIAGANSAGLFMYRDFQPRNIMYHNDQLWYIDFQSGMRGASLYDLASFLYSGSIELKDEERTVLRDHYAEVFCRDSDNTAERFTGDFPEVSFLRLVQILGSYAFVFSRKGERSILSKIPKALENIRKLKPEIKEESLKELAGEILKSGRSDYS